MRPGNISMNDLVWIIILSVIGIGLFLWLWRGGYLLRFNNYVRETREELRKCSWPTWDELKASTLLVGVAIVGLGSYTVGVDQIFFRVFMLFKL
jgi:preprotein translocase subunit SecE